ncbi:MAG: ABC transporter substrate-binding protein [Gammaproteobacteria bacterium]|nr:ABC transporter substrate-binding protein [Gammaproteobacteria bacterium]
MRIRAAFLGIAALRSALSAAAVAGLLLHGAPQLRAVPDDLSLTVHVGPPPLRIVSLSPGATEMLFAAGAAAEVIATTEYSDVPAEARRIPRIGDVAAIDMERLVALRPGVVVAWPAGGNPAQRQKIAALGIPVYEQQVDRLADLPQSLRRLGTLAGTAGVAERAARALEARLAALRQTYAGGAWGGERHPTVLLQVWNRPIYTIGGRQLMSDALALCGARNLFSDLPEPGPLVEVEAVIRRDPDIILAAAPPGEGAAWVADWRRFPTLEAVRHDRVVAFEDQALSRLGPSVFDATEHLCRTIARLGKESLSRGS